MRFAIGGSLLMAPLTAGCPEERGPNVNEPAPEPTVNEPADPVPEETVNEPDPGPERDRPIKVNEFPPEEEGGEGEGASEG